MQRLLATALLAVACAGLSAAPRVLAQRGGTSALSPRDTVKATVDGCDITIEYGRPSKRGRVIWGGLRPWDVWWMPGADLSTSIRTSAALLVGDLKMPAGAHTIYTLPGEKEFLLIINKEVGQFHTVYHPNRDLGHTPMTLTMLADPVEQMTFSIEKRDQGGGTLTLSWDDRAYSVAIARAQ